MKEKELGSLEAGKLADFIVLDRDYVTIPESDIENTQILMTVVGGQVVHLVPPLAGELGVEPVGAQYETGFWQEKYGSR
jgi:cytosine/adenosine deaminase-related metal-dependent hydrolase